MVLHPLAGSPSKTKFTWLLSIDLKVRGVGDGLGVGSSDKNMLLFPNIEEKVSSCIFFLDF